MGNQAVDVQGLPVEQDVIFSNHKDVYKKGVEKRQTKLLGKLSFIKPFLKKDEKILLVTTGCSPMSFVEQFMTGAIIFYLKRSLLVFTDRRIFHIPTKQDFTYRNSITQILYGDCEEIKAKGHTLSVRYKNGKTEKFYYMDRKERKKLKTILKSVPLTGERSNAGERTHLCPRCASVLVKDNYTCQNCRLEFKSKDEAKKLAFIYPGGGYFYTGHPFLGAGDAIVEAVLMLLVILSIYDMIIGIEGGTEGVIVFGIILVIEKIVSVYHSNHFVKEFLPKEKVVKQMIVAGE